MEDNNDVEDMGDAEKMSRPRRNEIVQGMFGGHPADIEDNRR